MNIDFKAELLAACKDARDAIAYLTLRYPGTTYGSRVKTLDALIKKAEEPATYQRVWDGNETERETKSGRIITSVVGWVYEVRVDGDYVDSFKKLADVKRAYPNAVKRGDD